MVRRLLPLLMLVALLVPRGARLSWCVCLEPPEADCCASLCCDDAPAPPGPEAAPEDRAAPDCCIEIEVEDFDELLDEARPVLPGPAALVAAAAPPERPAPAPRGALERRAPAPPRPAGLLPGVRPLRI